MTVAEFKQLLLEQGIPDDAKMCDSESWDIIKIEYLDGINEIELISKNPLT